MDPCAQAKEVQMETLLLKPHFLKGYLRLWTPFYYRAILTRQVFSVTTVVEFRSRFMLKNQFQINIFLVRLSLTFLRDVKNLAQFQKTKCFENESYQKMSITNVLLN